MTHSHFSWPNGLIDEDNYSSAKDMAILSSYAMKNKLFAKIVKTGYIETKDGYQIENHNRMLSRDKRCIGVKTGFTTLAGRTLVTCFKHPDNGQRIVIVTLNNYDHYNDHERLCNWVFDNFQQTTLVKKNSKVATVTDDGKTEGHLAVQGRRGLSYHQHLLRSEQPGRAHGRRGRGRGDAILPGRQEDRPDEAALPLSGIVRERKRREG